jgi:hypothetical protein
MTTGSDIIESVVIGGDLSKLTPEQRLSYYKSVCSSLGLNPLTKPFDYITLNGKLTLYARKDAADQLRKLHDVSITKLERERIDSIYTVTAYAQDKQGRQDSSIGAVNIDGLKGDALANAIMKAETKSKRRVTLSICGLGMLDETELETIKEYTEEVPQLISEPVKIPMSTTQAVAELGFELPPPPEEPAMNNPYKKFNVTLTQAQNVTGSDGVKYGDVTEKELHGTRIGIVRKMNIKNLPDEEKDELLYKVEAIDVLLEDLSKVKA